MKLIRTSDFMRLTHQVADLPAHGWTGYGAPCHPYSESNDIADSRKAGDWREIDKLLPNLRERVAESEAVASLEFTTATLEFRA